MVKSISDEAVKKNTGKIWREWFSILNEVDARRLEHKEIAKLLLERYGLSGWWSQMVTVQYEQEVKGRKNYEKPEGYQVSKSITLPFSVTKIFNVVKTPAYRKKWLKNPDFKITTAKNNKSIRAKWVDGNTNIEFQFYPKENGKVQLVVQHSKITSSKEAEKMKKYWEKNLTNLKIFLEKD